MHTITTHFELSDWLLSLYSWYQVYKEFIEEKAIMMKQEDIGLPTKMFVDPSRLSKELCPTCFIIYTTLT